MLSSTTSVHCRSGQMTCESTTVADSTCPAPQCPPMLSENVKIPAASNAYRNGELSCAASLLEDGYPKEQSCSPSFPKVRQTSWNGS